jgi:hypothetical protein
MMKIVTPLPGLFVFFILFFFSALVKAQVISGASDTTAAPPSDLTTVGKALCFGQPINLSGPQDVSNTNFAVYHWYKIDAGGNKQLTSITTRKYTETPTSAGYYNYELVTENTNGCTSPISDVFKIFVFPQLNVNIVAQNNSICTGVGATVLTANIGNGNTTYAYNFQWTRNGLAISGATSNTYTVTNETAAANIAFGVSVSYTSNPSCSANATQSINITPLATKPLITAN